MKKQTLRWRHWKQRLPQLKVLFLINDHPNLDLDGGRSGTDIEEDEDEDPDETLETEMSAESMESEEDEDDMDAGRKPFAPETDLEFEQELQASVIIDFSMSLIDLLRLFCKSINV